MRILYARVSIGKLLYYKSGIGESRAGRPTEGEASPAKDSRSDKNGRRNATESACTRASGRRDAEPRRGSNYPDGWGAPPRT